MPLRTHLAALAFAVLLVTAGCTTSPQTTPSPEQEPITPTQTATETASAKSATTETGATTSATTESTTSPEPTRTATETRTQTETTTEKPPEASENVTVRGSLPVEADTVLQRVETLMGRSIEPPRVDVERGPFSVPNMVAGRTVPDVFGLTGWEQRNTTHGLTIAGGHRVQLFPGNQSELSLESVLVHEFVHAVQLQTSLPMRGLQRRAETTDERIVAGALIEGGAVYVTDEYIAAHMADEPGQLSVLAEQYRRATPGYRFFRSRYYFGARYLHSRLGSPRNLSAAYHDPPNSTEALIHNGSAEPAPSLTVTLNTSDNWHRASLRDRNWNDTMGELIVRNVLRSELNRSRAAVGADGWGTDRLFALTTATTEPQHAIAWVIRWDSPADADEFVGAFEHYRNRHGPTTQYRYRLDRTGAETTTIVAGPPAALDGATVSGSNARVNVTVGG